MSVRTLFLSWQDKGATELWFPVARLDADVEESRYSFRYTGGAVRACEEAGFPLLLEFPDIERVYESPYLFAVFQNRVIAQGRPDRPEYLRNHDLPEDADPIDILAVTGGKRVTDAYEVFPMPLKRDDGSFAHRFCIRGWRHINRAARDRIESLTEGENLVVAAEVINPATGIPAVQIQTEDYFVIGWVPRYIVEELAPHNVDEPSRYRARVVRANPQTLISDQRVFAEMNGFPNGNGATDGDDYQPLVRTLPRHPPSQPRPC